MGDLKLLEGLADRCTKTAIPSVMTQKHFSKGRVPKSEKENRALNGVKFQLALKVQLQKTGPDGTEEYTEPVLRHKQETLLQSNEIDEALDKAIPTILETFGKWTYSGSGWVINQAETLWLDIARYQPLRGTSYIPLPAVVRNKKAVINVKKQG